MSEYSGKQALFTIRIIHFAMMGGLTLFGVVVFFLNSREEVVSTSDSNFLLILAGGATLMAAGISSILFKQQLSKLKGGEDLRSKMAAFQTAHIVRCALLEGAGMFSAVVGMLTHDNIALAGLALIVGIFFLNIPTAFSLERDLNLSSAEKQQLL